MSSENKSYKVDCGVAIVNPVNSWMRLTGPEQKAVLTCGIKFFDARLYGDGREGPEFVSKRVLDMLKQAEDAGLERRGHDWDGDERTTEVLPSRANRAEGQKDGFLAARRAIAARLKRYSINGERDLWKGPNGYANPSAIEYVDGFVDSFYNEATDCFLDWLGFSDPSYFYKTADLNKDGQPDNKIPSWLSERFGGVHVMAYQATAAAVSEKLQRARGPWPEPMKMGAYAAVGAMESDGVVRFGTYEGWKEVVKNQVAGFSEWTAYVGNIVKGRRTQCWEMLTRGNAKHGPITSLVREICAM